MAEVAKNRNTENLNRNEKQSDVRQMNILAAKAVADVTRTSLGPKGMDKMIEDGKGGVIITNDGATILKEMAVAHPTAKMIVELSKAQDVEAGDGTTSVVVMCGSLLNVCKSLLDKNIHCQKISESFFEASLKSEEILRSMSIPIDLNDKNMLIQNAITSLNSKVVSHNSSLLAPIAVDVILKITDINKDRNVDLNNIRIVKKLGGTIEDTEIVDGLIFTSNKISKRAHGIKNLSQAKIGLIQFCLSLPKTDMDNTVVVKDYNSMDRLLREERVIIAKMIKKIASTGCNLLLIQKSILRDAVNDLALDFLSKSKIMVIKDIEREDIEFISKTCNCVPVASLDYFTPDKLGYAENVVTESIGYGEIVKITGVESKNTISVLLRASNNLMLDEAERSLHDALCVVRSLIKERAILPGGAAPEMELSQKLYQWANTLKGSKQICVKAFSDALELIPYTLAENAGLSPLHIVTELRNKHAEGHKYAGINIRTGTISNMIDENVIQPLLVTSTAIKLATETVMMILKIDDTVICR
ncbi:T-complex protein 1 delta subunit [Plasmodium cynomolgi strain B]|uniref:T-complex protein 1 subunit delta n=1 Tax=Plasmodium cynomolgi (strain B) TaxID=1120755 RepID=K6VDA6_PLACD|nr:T-complex protein 1 delta subunit [Plasmodium cynomolgi strain B]GAB67207.1 T-complex protein 1 delta subunit [Plasmodium cynomolgi strain B]